MSVTVTPTVKRRFKWVGGQRANIVDLALTGTYATGGVALTAAECGLNSLENVICLNDSGFALDWVASTSKLKIYSSLPAVSAIRWALAAITASATKYIGQLNAEAASAAAAAPFVVPAAGYIRNLYASLGTAPGATKTYILSVCLNGTAQALTCTITGTAKTASDTTAGHAFAVAAGDLITLEGIETDGSAALLGASAAYEVSASGIGGELANATSVGTPTIRVLALGV